MIRLFTLIVACSIHLMAVSQTITGIVTDAKDDTPLISVNISIDGTTIGTTTDENGVFSIDIPRLPAVMTISYLGYKQRKIPIRDYTTTNLNIQLTNIAKDLTEIVVSAAPKVEVIYQEPYSVIDYEFYDQYVLLMVYKGIRKKQHLLLMNEAGDILDDISLKGKYPDKFFKSCLGGVHLMYGFYVQQLYVADEKIYLIGKTERAKFESLLNHCALATKDQVFFYEYMVMNQILEYFTISKRDKKANKDKRRFTSIVNLSRIRMAYDEGRFQQMADKIATILERPRQFAEIQSDKSFLSRVVYSPVYAPLFAYQDSICVFNHISKQLEFYTPDGTLMRSTMMGYEQSKRWKKMVIQDEATQFFYTLFKTKWGFDVRKINPNNGKTTTIFEIKYLFADNFKIKDGHLYFLFNNPRMNQPKYKLHKVRIE